jgi:hypothetical protein
MRLTTRAHSACGCQGFTMELEPGMPLARLHITDQVWVPEQREDGVYLVGAEDHTVILKMCRPDRGSDLLMAGYIAGLQALALRRKEGQ